MLKYVIMLTVIVTLFLTSLNLTASPSDSTLQEIIAEGRYVMGDRDSKSDARQYALLEAKQKIIEQAGTFIKSHDVVKNYTLTSQEIESFSVGLIKTEILEERTEAVGETRAVIVKIRGTINPAEIKNLLDDVRQEESTHGELADLQESYTYILQQLDSLKSTSTTPETNESVKSPVARSATKLDPAIRKQLHITSRAEGWKELERIELVMQIITEANKRKPNVAKLQKLTALYQQKHPNTYFTSGFLGIAQFKNGHFQPAIQNLQKGLKPLPARLKKETGAELPANLKKQYKNYQALFHFFLARSYKKTGKRRLAKRHILEARKLSPKDKRFNRP